MNPTKIRYIQGLQPYNYDLKPDRKEYKLIG